MKTLGLGRLLTNVAATMGRQLMAGLLQLITIVVIARIYGAEGNGSYTVSLLLPTLLASLLNLGIAPANVYFLATGKVSANAAWCSTLKLFSVIAPIGLILGWIAISCYSDKLMPGIPLHLLAISLLAFPLLLMQSLISSFFQGLQKFKQFNLLQLLHPSLTLSGVVLATLLDAESFTWLLVAHLIATTATAIVAYCALRPLIIGNKQKPEGNYELRIVNYGYKAHLSNILAFANYKADIFLVNFFMGPSGAGIYIVAVQLTERLWLLSQAVSTVLLPRLSELSNDDDKRAIITPLITRWVLLTTLIAGGVLAIVASPLIQIVFGSEFIAAFPPLLLLLPGVILGSASRVLANDIAARGRPELNMYTSVIVVAVNISMNIALIPNFGIAGAAIATTIAYSLNLAMRLAIHHLLTGIDIADNLIIRKDDLVQLKSAYHLARPKR